MSIIIMVDVWLCKNKDEEVSGTLATEMVTLQRMRS